VEPLDFCDIAATACVEEVLEGESISPRLLLRRNAANMRL